MEPKEGSSMPLYDEVITRLEKDLIRRKAKLDKKPTRWNKMQWNKTRDLLKRWKEEKELMKGSTND